MTTLSLTAARDANARGALLSGLFSPLLRMFRQAEARRQLLDLDDRMLRDIGLNRGDLAAELF